MNLAPVLELVQERTGLDPASLGELVVRSAVTADMHRLGLLGTGSVSDRVARYADRLRGDPAAFAALVEDLVVPETWFFRGGELFFYLAEYIRTTLRGRAFQGPFRVLSLPCSTGEEPYSLVIALTEIGVEPAGWQIDGIDLSQRNLERARRGVFSEMSFRQMTADLRQRYFSPGPGGWELCPELRRSVRFFPGNLLDPGLLVLLKGSPYDLVFCRNLFIYLTPAARPQALAAVARLTAPQGLLCLGHADPLDPDQGRWQRFGPADYFLFRRAPKEVQSAKCRVQSERQKTLPPASSFCTLHSALCTPLESLLAQARERADSGRLDEALELCQAAQQRHGPTAELCALSGIIHQARQEINLAVGSFRKALYLAPDHREALLHLMLLYQHLGEHNQAAVLRGRLERLSPLFPGGEA